MILPVTLVADKSDINRPQDTMQQTEADDQPEISKSQRKRAMDELKKLGMELLDFSDDALRQLQLPETLLEAICTGKRITSNNARKRQLQYIGKLLKDIDATPLHEAVDARNHQHDSHTREFHQLEELRDKLILDGERALPAVLALFPGTDRQRLLKLSRQARRERESGQPPRASRLLFRYLRELQESPDYL